MWRCFGGGHHLDTPRKHKYVTHPVAQRIENHNVLFALTVATLDKLNFYSALITALATGAIGYFTLTLKQSTDRLWDAAKEQARITENAFSQLEGPLIQASNLSFDMIEGPARPGDPQPTINIWLKNRGRGPGFIVVRAFSLSCPKPASQLSHPIEKSKYPMWRLERGRKPPIPWNTVWRFP
jgi:hypothetical protein